MSFPDEYITSSYDEYTYLRANHIFCCSVVSEGGESVYRYKKTPKLFAALSMLYDEVKSREEYQKLKDFFSDPNREVMSYSTIEEALKAAASMKIQALKDGASD